MDEPLPSRMQSRNPPSLDPFLYASEMEMGLSPQHGAGPSDAEWYGPPITDEWKASLESLGEAARIHRMEEFTSTAAKLLFNAREFHGAAFLFSRALHIAQQAKSVSDETVAALTNNVAAAYHGLGEWDEAVDRFKTAIQLFEALEAKRHSIGKWLDGDSTQRKIDFIRGRMELAARHERPPPDEWLDSSGTVRQGGADYFDKKAKVAER
mmetsp:Transcript_12001/g.39458  ORF Transcript_12001/g.39458 Transcript_12001/m.39458 type:complete len:210 (-) Transcript_12001:86-715(-)